LPNETTVSFLQDQALQAELLLLGFEQSPPAPGIGIEVASVIDYNGNIYGQLDITALGGMGGFGSPSVGSGSPQGDFENDVGYASAVGWQNYGAPDTMLGGLWIPDQIGTSSEQIISAKNNNTIGEIGTLIEPFLPPAYTVNGAEVSFTPIDISTAGVVIGTSSTNNPPSPNTYFLYNLDGADGTETIPGAAYLYNLNHATRNMTSSGTVTPVECPQVLGADANSIPMLFQKNPNTGSYEANYMDDLIGAASGWSGFAPSPGSYVINDSGLIIGTATYTPTGTADPIPAGQHGVLLVPVQITLLNGSTPDFDGTIVTGMPSDFPTPGVPGTPYGNSAADAGTNLGVATPMGAGRNNNAPDNAYSFVLMAATKAPPGFQYRWERFIQRRSWYIKKTTSGTNTFWDVSWRSSRGFSDGDTNDLKNPGDFDDSTPSSVKHEFYAHDSSALGYGFAGDSSMNTNDCIHEEKNFIYKVQISPDGTNWTDAATMPVAQSETITYKATQGSAATDWAGVPNFTGGNTMTQGASNSLLGRVFKMT
jgi:hypothetical protein